MNKHVINSTRLSQMVKSAFPANPVPPHLWQSEAMREADPWSLARVRSRLLGKKWTDLHCNDIEELAEDFVSEVSCIEFVYYLPAWLMCSVENKDNDYFVEKAINILISPAWQTMRQNCPKIMTVGNIEVICTFLTWCLDLEMVRSNENYQADVAEGILFWEHVLHDRNK